MPKIELSLIENSHNFLNESLAQAIIAEEKTEYWKYAILHLVQAIELSLKERLRIEHPSLIYKNIDNPKDTVSLKFAAEKMLMIDRVRSIDLNGGIWGLGLVIAEKALTPDAWYFVCHFKALDRIFRDDNLFNLRLTDSNT